MFRDHYRKENSKSSSTKLRMDDGSAIPFILPREQSNKLKELDNVMRKARESQSSYWNKKLLEVEEKDPNRWRHSGYKEMYVGSMQKSKVSDSISSHKYRDSEAKNSLSKTSLVQNLRRQSSSARNPQLFRSRSLKSRNSHSPRQENSRSSAAKLRSSYYEKSDTCKPNSSEFKNKSLPCSPSFKNTVEKHFKAVKKSRKSPSSGSTCSNLSCSLCSSSNDLDPVDESISRSRSVCSSKQNHDKKILALKNSPKKILKPRSPQTTERQNDSSSSQLSQNFKDNYRNFNRGTKIKKKEKSQRKQFENSNISDFNRKFQKRIKIEEQSDGGGVKIINRPVESSASDTSDSSSVNSYSLPPKMTLSERFGKMAQWSVDRRDMENMRITKVGNSTMKVVIEGEEKITKLGYDSPPPGHYPKSLLAQGPRGLECWDDVRVRYDYYKSRGYLRDLTLDDYIKWEEWWYKYQEWLEAERYYEQWAAHAASRSQGNTRKRRRRTNTVNQ